MNCELFFTENENVRKVTEDQKESCEGEITETEMLNVLKTCKNNKSPGSDGFPAEFYKVFWNDIKTFLLKAINMAYHNGILSNSQRHGVISLLPKKDKNILELSNWRPITLINQDYKLASKCIAYRIKKVLPDIIHEDQTGYIKDRYIGENINRIMNLIDYTDEQDIPALLVLIDFEKAFDSLEWNFIRKVLQYFNFGPSLLKWIDTLYTDIQNCVINNGWTSKAFSPSRGVRQGCPLSPYLFVLSIEILSIFIRNDSNIEGIKIDAHEFKISQYADDTSLTLLASENNLTSAINVFKDFQKNFWLKNKYE